LYRSEASGGNLQCVAPRMHVWKDVEPGFICSGIGIPSMIDIEQFYGGALDCGAGSINDISCDCCSIHLSHRLLTRVYEKNYRQQKSCAAKGEVGFVAFKPAFMNEQSSQRTQKRGGPA
jgi:hypothetical protein